MNPFVSAIYWDFVNVTFSSRQTGDVSVLEVSGTVTMGESSTALRHALSDLVANNHNKLLLNLAGLTFIDSSGIREIMSIYNTMVQRGGQLKLLNPTQRLKDLLRITRLETVLEVYDNEAAAIQSFT